MVQAVWNDTVLAKSDDTVVLQGRHYFHRDDVKTDFLRPSETTSTCTWRGAYHYYDLEVDGERLEDAAFFFPAPTEAAQEIAHRIAFWKDVEVEE